MVGGRKKGCAGRAKGGGAEAKIDPSVLPAEMFSVQAERQVKIGLLVHRIIEQNEIKPDDARVKETIENMASSYEEPDQVLSYYYNNEDQLNQIQNVVLEEQIVDLVLASATVTDIEVSYEEAVKREEPASDSESDDDAETSETKAEAD